MLTEREQKIEKLIDSQVSHDNHYLVSNNQVRHFLFTINHLREERGKWEERFNTAFENNIKYIEENKRLREALEDIAFGRVEGDYSDARQYASEVLEEKK